jgi:phosphonate transport system substrate-binding protein
LRHLRKFGQLSLEKAKRICYDMSSLNPFQECFVSLISKLFFAVSASLLLSSCTVKKAEIGTEKNPIKLFFVPSVEAQTLEDNSKVFKAFLEANTPYKFEVSIPQSYIAVVEAFGSKRADIAALTTFGYILANQKYGAEARLTVLRHGASTYQSQFIAKADGPIKTLADFAGKKIAFVDPASASGFLLPKKMLNEKGIKPAQEIFAMKHDAVVSMIYTGQIEGGATFYSPSHDGEVQDARRLVKTQYPDVAEKIKIVQLSDMIPNEPIVFRKDLPEEMKTSLTDAFLKFVATPEGKDAFSKIYGVTDLIKATDKDYDGVRAMLTTLGTTADDLMAKSK